jgi:RNA polymerase sigma factor (TIGR02999 family)
LDAYRFRRRPKDKYVALRSAARSVSSDPGRTGGPKLILDFVTSRFGDSDARKPNRLFVSLYEELRRLARREVRRNGAQAFLSTTTVVHEAWLDLSGRSALDFDHPARFLGYAARTMRGLVVDRLRAVGAQKRGGGINFTSLDTHTSETAPAVMSSDELHVVAEALEELAKLDPDLAEIVDLRFFCGFTFAEVARMQGLSERTVQRKWAKARAVLFSVVNQ